MDTRPALCRRRSLLVVLVLLGGAGWTTASPAAAPSPQEPAPVNESNGIVPALPWQFTPALMAPGLMPEAYYMTNTVVPTSPTVPGTPGTPSTPTTPTTPTTPVTPYIPPGGSPPDAAPEPATLVTSLIGVGLLGLRIWRRRSTRDREEYAE